MSLDRMPRVGKWRSTSVELSAAKTPGAGPPIPAAAAALLSLQHAAGNRAVGQLIARQERTEPTPAPVSAPFRINAGLRFAWAFGEDLGHVDAAEDDRVIGNVAFASVVEDTLPQSYILPGTKGRTAEFSSVEDSEVSYGPTGFMKLTGQLVAKGLCAVLPRDANDVSGADDPIVTRKSWPHIVRDLTPNLQTLNPPRYRYWSRDISWLHERAHAHRYIAFVRQRLGALNEWLSRQTMLDPTTEVEPLLEAAVKTIIKEPWRLFTKDEDARERPIRMQDQPYYEARVFLIKRRAQAEGWDIE
jgi:hypothetical protein